MNRLVTLILFAAMSSVASYAEELEADLLVVGGTESGCAAAVQAARMGVQRIVLVNDIEWLGGQFSAEGLGAIDENRAHGYDGTVPIPRSGLFREVIDSIENENAGHYGVRRPGNTRVITTCRPVVAEKVFRDLLKPFETSGQITRRSSFDVRSVLTVEDRVVGVNFVSIKKPDQTLTVRAKLTIDASDWGDVIKGSNADWDAGIDAKSEFDEPSAPELPDPKTDMNPITWCMILEQHDKPSLFPRPAGYNEAYFGGKWGWIDEEFAYSTRRLVDGQGIEKVDHPDILLINNPSIDYPLDTYPQDVVAKLEQMERGASKKNIVAMTSEQRQVVFRDARKHTLKYYYHLQSRFKKFRNMALSEEFGTPDKLPPKPYVRESLRLVAKHIIREQEVLGFENRSNYATEMFADAVFCWQFEMDYHPTRRSWVTDAGAEGAWEATFRGKRRFGRGGTGRAVFPMRALIPLKVKGLLGAQKNLGFTSIVGSSCRLHDQSIHAGQAAGALAAVGLRHDEDPGGTKHLPEIWTGLLDANKGTPMVIWPFSDVDPYEPGFGAIQQLALRRVLNLDASETEFRPDAPVTEEWASEVLQAVSNRGYEAPVTPELPQTRREFAKQLWAALQNQSIPNEFFDAAIPWKRNPKLDGLPDFASPFIGFNFADRQAKGVDGFKADQGKRFSKQAGFGWQRDMTNNTRFRKADTNHLRAGFVFTRAQDVWEYEIENGLWQVDLSLGDSEHEQHGQFVRIEGQSVAENIDTQAGRFQEFSTRVEVQDGRLTVTLGRPEGGSNTCINWLTIRKNDAIDD